MKKILLFLIIIAFYGCNKTKTVLICGDHVCVNKAEAEQYFEDNLTLEVKVIDKKIKKSIDLVELNLKTNIEGKKEITLLNKDKTREEVKVLSNDEIQKKKDEIKKRKKNKKKEIEDKKIVKKIKVKKTRKKRKLPNIVLKPKKNVNKSSEKITDICTILEKCSIDEISRYLVKQGKKKRFPDITIRENK